jgi:hypothetical protein
MLLDNKLDLVYRRPRFDVRPCRRLDQSLRTIRRAAVAKMHDNATALRYTSPTAPRVASRSAGLDLSKKTERIVYSPAYRGPPNLAEDVVSGQSVGHHSGHSADVENEIGDDSINSRRGRYRFIEH